MYRTVGDRGEDEVNAGRTFLRVFLMLLSLLFLSLATFAGLMHEWHRLAFISLAGLDDSLAGTLVFLLAGIACWILAGLLPDD
jgi:hypothetical protein